MAWLPVVVLAVVQITVRVIGVVGLLRQERARAEANCSQMQVASASKVVLWEQRGKATLLLIVPQDLLGRGGNGAKGTAGSPPKEAAVP
jgi:hypothetical protein